MGWELEPGDSILRKTLHDTYGGKRQGGISPSTTTPNVMIFSDPDTGHQHGYLDRWEDGVLHYTGEGQNGPQQLAHGNAQILRHANQGRALRVFDGSSGEVTYLGRFELDDPPYYYARAPQTDSDSLRTVIMFRLLPDDHAIATAPEKQLSGHTPIVPETTAAAGAVAQLAGDRAPGQGFSSKAVDRKAIEARAMQLALEHYEDLGWTVTDVSGNSSWDLTATKPGHEKHIEVKGTTSLGQEVLLTPNEVKHARVHPDVALYVVHSIQLTSDGTNASAAGGIPVIYDPWTIDDGHLAPIGYAYSIPGDPTDH